MLVVVHKERGFPMKGVDHFGLVEVEEEEDDFVAAFEDCYLC